MSPAVSRIEVNRHQRDFDDAARELRHAAHVYHATADGPKKDEARAALYRAAILFTAAGAALSGDLAAALAL